MLKAPEQEAKDFNPKSKIQNPAAIAGTKSKSKITQPKNLLLQEVLCRSHTHF